MERKLGSSTFSKWTKSVGGRKAAAKLIVERLECSESKAEKIASGRYPSLPTPLEQIALAALIGVSRDVLFPFKKKALIAS